jgi:hypothetical protein
MATSRGLADVAHGRRRARLRLLAPIRYLSIRHSEKNLYDLVAPALLAVAMWIAYYLIAPKPPLFGDSGILRFTRDLLVMGVPFMIGALATVAMGSPGSYLDRRPAGAELYLDGEALTLRQFVCYLLGYMSFLGIATLLASVAATLVHDAVLPALGHGHLYAFVLNSGTAVLFLLLSALLVTVLWSLYFLTEVVNAKSRFDGAPPANEPNKPL